MNRYIFGFSDVSEYEQLIDLLVQLRSPKLSKDYKPTVLYEIMEESLKPLSDEDLRPMSEAIESMDMIEASIAELKSVYDSARRLKTAYDRYNQATLYYKAEDYLNADAEAGKLSAMLEDIKSGIAERERIAEEQRAYAAAVSELKRAEETLNDEKSALIEKIYAWNSGNELLTLTGDALQKTAALIYAFEDFSELEPISSAAFKRFDRLRSDNRAKTDIAERGRHEAAAR